MKVEFFKHNIEEEDTSGLLEVLKTPMLSMGAKVVELEEGLKKYLSHGHFFQVRCVNSCTSALHLALLLEGIKKGDHVITTPMTFIATLNAIMYTGAKPLLVDVDPSTGCIDPKKIKEALSKKTKALLVVHLYGQLCDMDKIDKLGLPIIEDSAHALDTYGVGLWGSSCYSFYPTKSITCGEGGALSILSEEKADSVEVLRLHGMDKSAWKRYQDKYKHWDMTHLGYKYNMTNLQASLLLPQLAKAPAYLKRRRAIHKYYQENLSNLPGVSLLETSSGSSKLMFTIIVKGAKRDAFMALLQEEGVSTVINFRAVHTLGYYSKALGYKRGDFPNAEKIGDGTITLPLYPKLTDGEVNYIVEVIKRCSRKL